MIMKLNFLLFAASAIFILHTTHSHSTMVKPHSWLDYKQWLPKADGSIVFDYVGQKSGRQCEACLLYTSPSPRDKRQSRMPSSA